MKWWAGCLPSLVTLGLLKGEITHFNSISRDPVINKPHDLLGSDFLIPSHKACDKNIIINKKKNICNLQISAFLFFILGKLCSIANWGRSAIRNSSRYCNLG